MTFNENISRPSVRRHSSVRPPSIRPSVSAFYPNPSDYNFTTCEKIASQIDFTKTSVFSGYNLERLCQCSTNNNKLSLIGMQLHEKYLEISS